MTGRKIDPTIISPSRLGQFSECGRKFEFRYIDGIKPPRAPSRQLFGSVMHRAREQWVQNRKVDMVPFVKEAWVEQGQKDKPLGSFLAAYEDLSVRARIEKDTIAQRRPELKNVNASKDWKEHPLKLQIDALVAALHDRMEGSVWTFTKTDPLPSLYDESISLARAYAARWRHLPDAAMVEVGFTVQWQGFTLTGRIDDVTEFQHPVLGRFYGLTDAKTHQEDPFAPKFLDQCVMYFVAVRECMRLRRPGFERLDPDLPFMVAIDAMRLYDEERPYRFFEVDQAQEDRLLRVLQTYKRGVEHGVYTPNATRCDSMGCGFREMCEAYYAAKERDDLNVWFATGEVLDAVA
jgi:hypothetical protein